MENETYYFYKHYKLYQSALNDIMMFSCNNYKKDCEIYYEDRIFDRDLNNDSYYDYNDKLYGNYDDWEDYWDSIYG